MAPDIEKELLDLTKTHKIALEDPNITDAQSLILIDQYKTGAKALQRQQENGLKIKGNG